jgi:hypothetical protein
LRKSDEREKSIKRQAGVLRKREKIDKSEKFFSRKLLDKKLLCKHSGSSSECCAQEIESFSSSSYEELK